MRKLILSTMLVTLLGTPVLASGPGATAQQVPLVAAQIQTMKINEVISMKVTKQMDFSAAGIKAKEGDEVEVKKIAGDKIQVKHLPSGQIGIMPQPK